METLNIPEGYQQVMPYLIIPDAAGFLTFVKKVFGAEEKHMTMRDETHIRHGEVKIGESTIMFADATEQFPARPGGFFIYVKNADESYRTALQTGARSISEPADQPYGRSCGVTDAYGNTWWITSQTE